MAERMLIPLQVVAHLRSPAVMREPILLDGVLIGGLGAQLGAEREDGWACPEEVYAADLPLARVPGEYGWWWAASQASFQGPEEVTHAHRRMPLNFYERWTSAASTNAASGPDKSLRSPLFYRPSMLRVVWTCVGDPDAIARILSWVMGIGHRTTDGFGQVERWEVLDLPELPDVLAYGRDLELRHLPVWASHGAPVAIRTMRRLRPPYWKREDAVLCWTLRGDV